MTDRSLAKLPIGARARIADIIAEPSLEQRLLAMGLLPGTEVEVVRQAPLGDPIEIKVLGYSLSLRRSEAACVKIEDPA